MTAVIHNYVTYNMRRCRCFTCRLAKSEYEREVRDGLRLGYVDSGPAVARIAELRAAGFGIRRIAAATGVSITTVQYLHARPRIHSTTAARVLAFTSEPAPKQGRSVPALGTHRRMQALCVLGWSFRAQVLDAGLAASGSSRPLAYARVERTTADKIRALYERLSMTVAPQGRGPSRARGRAAREQFFPPLAWDEETIDDPDALPCLLPPVEPVSRELELQVQHLVAGHAVEPIAAAVKEIIRRMPDAKNREIAKVAQTTNDRVSYLRGRRREEPC